jgi:hypothetical protein
MRGQKLLVLEREVSRRAFLNTLIRTGGIAAALPTLQKHLWAINHPTPDQVKSALAVVSAIGNLVVPEDQDPGWLTFDPGITRYTYDVFLRQIFLNGNGDAADAFVEALNHVNDVPAQLSYNLPFLQMSLDAQQKYLTDVLTGQFENDGWQDVLNIAMALTLVAAKSVFFSNYPRHLAQADAEFQVLPPSPVKTGWDIMGLKGPVGPAEEKALRNKAQGAQEIAGIDWRNPYI